MVVRTLFLLSAAAAMVACSPRPEARETPSTTTTTPSMSDTSSSMRADTMRRDTTLRDTSRMTPATPPR